MTQLQELGALFDAFAALFDELSTLQQDKMTAARADDLAALDHCMQREQAFALKLRGMQRQKDTLHAALGLPDVPLRAVPDHLSPADRAQIAPAVRRFTQAYTLYTSAAAASRATLEGFLQEIDAALAQMERPAGQPALRQAGNFTDIKA